MDIAQSEWPDEEHIFVFDNAPTHLKRADEALPVRNMPKNPSATFGVDVAMIGVDGKPMYVLHRHRDRLLSADICSDSSSPVESRIGVSHGQTAWFS